MVHLLFQSQYTWSEEVGSRVDTIIYNFLPPYQDDSLLPSTNFKIKDVITIVNFQLWWDFSKNNYINNASRKNP